MKGGIKKDFRGVERKAEPENANLHAKQLTCFLCFLPYSRVWARTWPTVFVVSMQRGVGQVERPFSIKIKLFIFTGICFPPFVQFCLHFIKTQVAVFVYLTW